MAASVHKLRATAKALRDAYGNACEAMAKIEVGKADKLDKIAGFATGAVDRG